MKKIYRTKCWYCGSSDMEDAGDYWRCRACGTTHTEPLETQDGGITITNDPRGASYNPMKQSAAHPSAIATRRAGSPRESAG